MANSTLNNWRSAVSYRYGYHRAPPEVKQEVIALRREHPDWGKKRIGDELAKGNNWVPLVSPNTVKRILEDAGLWKTAEASEGKKAREASQSDRGAA